MQIVIDISEEDFEKIKKTSFVENTETMFNQSSEDRNGTMMLFRVIDAIKDATPLEAQPTDAVSRKRVIILIDKASEIYPYKVVGDYDTYSNYNQGWSDACDWLYANIDGIPSVTPQRPNGKWIPIRNYQGLIIAYKCSNCEKTPRRRVKSNYCPNCGAEMSGGGEDDIR